MLGQWTPLNSWTGFGPSAAALRAESPSAVVSLVRRLIPFLGVLECSTKTDVGVPLATDWVCGLPRLVAADLSARPALAGRG